MRPPPAVTSATTVAVTTAAGRRAAANRARLSAPRCTFPRVRRLSIARSVQLALLGLTIALTAIAGFGVGALYSSRQAYEDRLAHAFEVKASAGKLLAASVVEEATLRARRAGSAGASAARAQNAYAGALADTRRKAADDDTSLHLVDRGRPAPRRSCASPAPRPAPRCAARAPITRALAPPGPAPGGRRQLRARRLAAGAGRRSPPPAASRWPARSRSSPCCCAGVRRPLDDARRRDRPPRRRRPRARASTRTAPAELRELGRAFNAMADDLERRHARGSRPSAGGSTTTIEQPRRRAARHRRRRRRRAASTRAPSELVPELAVGRRVADAAAALPPLERGARAARSTLEHDGPHAGRHRRAARRATRRRRGLDAARRDRARAARAAQERVRRHRLARAAQPADLDQGLRRAARAPTADARRPPARVRRHHRCCRPTASSTSSTTCSTSRASRPAASRSTAAPIDVGRGRATRSPTLMRAAHRREAPAASSVDDRRRPAAGAGRPGARAPDRSPTSSPTPTSTRDEGGHDRRRASAPTRRRRAHRGRPTPGAGMTRRGGRARLRPLLPRRRRAARHPGTGLGLSIVQARSSSCTAARSTSTRRPGEGTTLHRPPARARRGAERRPRRADALRGRRVLVVDDEPEIARADRRAARAARASRPTIVARRRGGARAPAHRALRRDDARHPDAGHERLRGPARAARRPASCAACRSSSCRCSPGSEALAGEWVVTKPIDADELRRRARRRRSSPAASRVLVVGRADAARAARADARRARHRVRVGDERRRGRAAVPASAASRSRSSTPGCATPRPRSPALDLRGRRLRRVGGRLLRRRRRRPGSRGWTPSRSRRRGRRGGAGAARAARRQTRRLAGRRAGEGEHDRDLGCCRGGSRRSSEPAAEKERQLERYAADLRETFKQERARAQELRRSYMATVRALCQRRRGARRLHRQARRARRRLRAGDRRAPSGIDARRRPRRSSSASCCTTSARSRSPTRSCSSPSRSTDDERALMEQPPGDRLRRSCATIDFLGEAKLVVRHHHERWDGDGYPDGLAGEDDPARGARVRRRRHARRADHRPPLPARPSPFADARARSSRRAPARSSTPTSSRRSTTIPDAALRAHPREAIADDAHAS